MSVATQNSSTISETLKARKAHLTALLKIVDTNPGKSTATQNLTITAIKAEMGLIEDKLKKW
jgi:DNA uptake protein ComE-like DNA-binding protein